MVLHTDTDQNQEEGNKEDSEERCGSTETDSGKLQKEEEAEAKARASHRANAGGLARPFGSAISLLSAILTAEGLPTPDGAAGADVSNVNKMDPGSSHNDEEKDEEAAAEKEKEKDDDKEKGTITAAGRGAVSRPKRYCYRDKEEWDMSKSVEVTSSFINGWWTPPSSVPMLEKVDDDGDRLCPASTSITEKLLKRMKEKDEKRQNSASHHDNNEIRVLKNNYFTGVRESEGLNPQQECESVPFGQDGPYIIEPTDKCSVCLEEKPSVKLCGMGCEGTCEDCLQQYFAIEVGKALYAMPMIRCPGTCQSRVPTAIWTEYAKPEDVRRYKENAVALLAVRCSECDDTVSLFLEEGTRDGGIWSKENSIITDKTTRGIEKKTNEESNEDGHNDVQNKKKGDDDNKKDEDKNDEEDESPGYHRYEDGTEEKKETTVYTRLKRTLDPVFEELGPLWYAFWCGTLPAEAFMDIIIDQMSPSRLRAAIQGDLLVHITDLERRLVFQLAYYRRFPKIRTPCCNDKMCFKCKVSNWHPGVSCEHKQRQEARHDVQNCPNCNVPTQRSEGCNQIHCVCGENWSWAGSEHDDDDDAEEHQSDAVELVTLSTDVEPDTRVALLRLLMAHGGRLSFDLALKCRRPEVIQLLREKEREKHPQINVCEKNAPCSNSMCPPHMKNAPEIQDAAKNEDEEQPPKTTTDTTEPIVTNPHTRPLVSSSSSPLIGPMCEEIEYEAILMPMPGPKPVTLELERYLFSIQPRECLPFWAKFFVTPSSSSTSSCVVDDRDESQKKEGDDEHDGEAAFDATAQSVWAHEFRELSSQEMRDPRFITTCLRLAYLPWRPASQKHRGTHLLGLLHATLRQEQYDEVMAETATTELCVHLGECVGYRLPEYEYCKALLEAKADATHHTEFDHEIEGNPRTPLDMVIMNQAHVPGVEETMEKFLKLLLDHGVDVNEFDPDDDGNSPLGIAIRFYNPRAVEVLMDTRKCRITAEALEELKTISNKEIRERIQVALLKGMDNEEGYEIDWADIEPWVLIQYGMHSRLGADLHHDFDADDVKSLIRSRGDEESKKTIEKKITKTCGKKEFQEHRKEAATALLLEELREAWETDREINVELVEEALKMGANLRVREEPNDDSDDEDEDDEDSYLPLELVALHTKVGQKESTKKVIEMMVREGGRSLLDFSDEESDNTLGLAIKMGNFSVVQILIEQGAEITDKTWKECHYLFGSDDILPTLHLLYDRAVERKEKIPLWLLLRLKKWDDGTDGTWTPPVESTVDEAPYVRKMLSTCVIWPPPQEEEGRVQYEKDLAMVRKIAKEAYDGMPETDNARSFEDAVKRSATHILLNELSRCYLQKNQFKFPDIDRVRMLLNYGADPNVKEHELTDFDTDDEDDDDDDDSQLSSDDDSDDDDDDDDDSDATWKIYATDDDHDDDNDDDDNDDDNTDIDSDDDSDDSLSPVHIKSRKRRRHDMGRTMMPTCTCGRAISVISDEERRKQREICGLWRMLWRT